MSGLEWAGNTTVHPIGLALLGLCAFAVIFARREYVLIPYVLMIVAIPSAQRIVIETIDFSFLRILIIVVILRAVLKGDHRGLHKTVPDKLLIIYLFWGILSYGLLVDNFSGYVARAGYMLDVVGSYWIGRIYIRSESDLIRIVRFLGYAVLPMAFVFTFERLTGKNLFSVFGGVPEFTDLREGRLRCQGPFSHPIMAGVFWGALFPLFLAMWKAKRDPFGLTALFVVSGLVVVINTASSTPVMSLVFGVIGMAMFTFWNRMRAVQIIVLICLIVLHITMNNPIWHLISRMDLVGGSTGWYRFYLIDSTIKHFDEWWLIGIRNTAHWGPGLEDITNQYILEGVRGGVLGLAIFSAFAYSIFCILGNAMRGTESQSTRWMFWGLGVMFFVHMMNFLAVSYFGQMLNALFLFFGMTVSVAFFSLVSTANSGHWEGQGFIGDKPTMPSSRG